LVNFHEFLVNFSLRTNWATMACETPSKTQVKLMKQQVSIGDVTPSENVDVNVPWSSPAVRRSYMPRKQLTTPIATGLWANGSMCFVVPDSHKIFILETDG
jgi:hypothetical protein